MDKIIDKLDTVPGMILAEIIIIGIIILAIRYFDKKGGDDNEETVKVLLVMIPLTLTLPMSKGRGFLVAAEKILAGQFISDRSYPKLGLCHQPS